MTTLATPRQVTGDAATGPIRVKVTTTQATADPGRQPTGTLHTVRIDGAGSSNQTFDGLVFVDGVLSTDKSVLSKLNPKDIVSVEVIKGKKAAEQSSGPAAANGIIRITTKAGAAK